MTVFGDEPCGADGLSFPNGLPEDGERVLARTVWSNGKWREVIFREKYAYNRQYDWFGVYSKPRVHDGSLPIVLEWRRIND